MISCDCSADICDEAPSCCVVKVRKARKSHTCEECGDTIKAATARCAAGTATASTDLTTW